MGFTASYEGDGSCCIIDLNVLYDIGLSAVCGGELDMETGQLESPNYPEDYHPNKECVWRVTVPKGFQVALKFQSFEVRRSFFAHVNYIYAQSSKMAGVEKFFKFPAQALSRSTSTEK